MYAYTKTQYVTITNQLHLARDNNTTTIIVCFGQNGSEILVHFLVLVRQIDLFASRVEV